MSFNSAEDRVLRSLNGVTEALRKGAGATGTSSSRDAGADPSGSSDWFRHTDDGLLSAGLLSRTRERPQGWNRGTGQWEHYTLGEGADFGELMSVLAAAQGGGGGGELDVRLGCEVLAVMKRGGVSGGGGWSLAISEKGVERCEGARSEATS